MCLTIFPCVFKNSFIYSLTGGIYLLCRLSPAELEGSSRIVWISLDELDEKGKMNITREKKRTEVWWLDRAIGHIKYQSITRWWSNLSVVRWWLYSLIFSLSLLIVNRLLWKFSIENQVNFIWKDKRRSKKWNTSAKVNYTEDWLVIASCLTSMSSA